MTDSADAENQDAWKTPGGDRREESLKSPEALLAMIDTDRTDEIYDALDDLVHDIAREDSDIDVSGVEDPDEIIDLRSLWASELNNQGVDEQVSYALKQGYLVELARILAPIAQSRHDALALVRLAGADLAGTGEARNG